MKQKHTLIFGILLLIGIATSVFLWFQVNNQSYTLNRVNVQVVSVKEERPLGLKGGVEYIVTVRHEGKEKKLNNVSSAYQYIIGGMTEVFESNGALYADEDGVKTSSNIALYYFGSLAVNLILLIIWIGCKSYKL